MAGKQKNAGGNIFFLNLRQACDYRQIRSRERVDIDYDGTC